VSNFWDHHISEFNVAFDPLHFVLMYPRGEAGWGMGIEKGKPRQRQLAFPVVDDIGEVFDPPGGGAEVGVTGEDLDLLERTLGEAAAEQEPAESSRGGTVTVRDYMAYYLFPRPGSVTWLLFFV
jgi:hypothetical protein